MARVDELQREVEALRTKLVAERIGDAFNRSKFIADRVLIPPDMLRDRFGGAFSLDEGGRVVATDASGNRILSRARPGEIADFDEALEALIAVDPHRASILKSHGGNGGSGNGAAGTEGVITREEWNKLNPLQQRVAATTKKLVD